MLSLIFAFVILWVIFLSVQLLDQLGHRLFRQSRQALGRRLRLGVLCALVMVLIVGTAIQFHVNPYAVAVACAMSGFAIVRLMGEKAVAKKDVPDPPLAFTLYLIALMFGAAFAIQATLLKPFRVSISAMAPSVQGDRFEGKCAYCGHIFHIMSFGQSVQPAVQCPNCSQAAALNQKVTKGDRLLIDRLGVPDRWQIASFENPYRDREEPELRSKPTIVRVVGLPGESIELVTGDVFIDGRRIVKPADELLDLWIQWSSYSWASKVSESPWVEQKSGGVLNYRWKPLVSIDLVTGADLENLTLISEKRPVRDVLLNVAFDGSEASTVQLKWQYGELHAVVSARRNTPGITIETLGGRTVVDDAKFTKEMSIAVRDGVISAMADGRVVGTVPFESHLSKDTAGVSSVADGRCELEIVCSLPPIRADIHRDVHYLTESTKDMKVLRALPGQPFTIASNSYFVLADDSGAAEDSRNLGEPEPGHENYCQAGTFPKELLVGVGRWIYMPLTRSRAIP